MRKILTIAVREYQAAVRTKAFVMTLLVLPLFMGGSVAIQVVLRKMDEKQAQRIAVVDRTPGRSLYPVLAEEAQRHNEAARSTDHESLADEFLRGVFELEAVEPGPDSAEAIRRQRQGLATRVRNGELSGYLDIGPEVTADAPPPAEDAAGNERAGLHYWSKTPAFDRFAPWAQEVINRHLRQQRLQRLHLSEAKVKAALAPFLMHARAVPRDENAEEESERGQMANLLVPAILMVTMFMMVLFGSSPLLQGVLEEKTQRIAEVLLGSVRPFNLMLGKLLGMIGVSLTVLAVYFAAGYWAADHYGYAQHVPFHLLGWLLAYQVLAVLMYGSVFIAIGAACTDSKETQTMMMPVSLLIAVPMFFTGSLIRDPNRAWLVAASFFPPWTPMLMVGRMAVPPGIPWWQPALGVVLVLAATLACVYVAGRIFRVGMLMQGKGARLSELLHWVLRG